MTFIDALQHIRDNNLKAAILTSDSGERVFFGGGHLSVQMDVQKGAAIDLEADWKVEAR